MKKKTTKQLCEQGEELYNSFCGMFKGFKISTPRTNTLELFALLDKKKEYEILLREMMYEFMSNLEETVVFVEEGKLYKKVSYKELF